MAKYITFENIVAGGDDIRVRQVSADICGAFEDLLDRFGIDLPSEDREGNEEEAHIYGDVYSDLEDEVTEKLVEFAEIVRKYDKPLNDDEY